MKSNARKGSPAHSGTRSSVFSEAVGVTSAPLALVEDVAAFGMVTVATAAKAASGKGGAGKVLAPHVSGSDALAAIGAMSAAGLEIAAAASSGDVAVAPGASALAALGGVSDVDIGIAAIAAKAGPGAGGNPDKSGVAAPRGGEGVGQGGASADDGDVATKGGDGYGKGGNPLSSGDGLPNPDRGPNQDGENPGKRPEDAGNPDNGSGDGTGDGEGKPDDSGNPGSGNGDGTGDGDGVSDRPPPAPTPADVPLLDAETVKFKSRYTFQVQDVTVGWDGETIGSRPESLDLTTERVLKDGTILNPIDSEFGFYVTDFVGAREKNFDADVTPDYAEGWVGALAGGSGIALADSRTDVFSTPARLGTWLEGIGGNTVKASTEHYSVMQAILSDQKFPGDGDSYFQLDDDLWLVDYKIDGNGMPIDDGDPTNGKLTPDDFHHFYVKELVQALGQAAGGGTAPEAPIDFSTAGVLGFKPGLQDLGDFTISPDGLTLSQDSQSWENILGDFTITSDTRLKFDFSAAVAGEIHGIMFANGDVFAPGATVQIAGSQDWGLGAYATYVAGSGVQSFDIPIGELFTGTFDRMVFITDDDAGVGASSVWSNVVLTDGSTPSPSAPIDFDRDGVNDVYRAFMADVVLDGTTRNVAAVDIGNDGTIDFQDGGLNGFGTFGLQDLMAPNESSILEDIAVGDDYSVTVKDDGKLLYRWGNAVKRPNDIRVDAKMELPDEWKTDANDDGFADKLYKVTAAELVVRHTVTNNPNDQIRPEDFENEAAIGILPTYVEVIDPLDPTNILWVADKGVYAGDGTFLPSYFSDTATSLIVTTVDGEKFYANVDAAGNPIGTVLRDFSLIDKAAASTLAGIGALSADLVDGFTEAYWTTMDREPFVADLNEDGTAYDIGPRWRLQPDKYGQDLPSVVIPQDITDPPPIQNGEEKYEAGADTTTVLNLLDWDGPSPLSLSAGWMTGAGEVSDNGLNMTDKFDVAYYVKGDMKPVSLYGADLLMNYEEVTIHNADTAIAGTIMGDTLVGRGGNTFDMTDPNDTGPDGRADIAVIGYGQTTAAGLGENFVFNFSIEDGDAIGLIGFGLDPDNYNIHITQKTVDADSNGVDDLTLALDDDHFATLYNVTEELGVDHFYFA